MVTLKFLIEQKRVNISKIFEVWRKNLAFFKRSTVKVVTDQVSFFIGYFILSEILQVAHLAVANASRFKSSDCLQVSVRVYYLVRFLSLCWVTDFYTNYAPVERYYPHLTYNSQSSKFLPSKQLDSSCVLLHYIQATFSGTIRKGFMKKWAAIPLFSLCEARKYSL